MKYDSQIIEDYLKKPYWVIDILPKQVPENSGGQYFEIEKYFLKQPQFEGICKKFSNILIKLNCYYDISIYNVLDEQMHNPQPDLIETWLSSGSIVYTIIDCEDAMIGFDGDEHSMALYNPHEELLQIIRDLAAAEGLFVWKPMNQ